MSKQDKKETTTSTTDSTTRDNLDQVVQNNTEIFNRAVKETTQSLNQVFDESKKSIERNINEARNQIPLYTKTINEVQEQAVQATRDIAENYLDYQKQTIDSFQSIVTPYFENANNQLWNNQGIFRRIPEIYSKIANNYAENTVALSRIMNNIAFSNVDIVKSVINNTKEQSKQFAEIGKRNARVYESFERDNRNSR
ncbi:hypothetical protein [Candidatus Nitrosocosmicus arcticus]|uniref:Uncharacterized protein n=1 Tax=Candidatus Nitrosocosmicus arcticus TaxID=2035267 RepID=A0A557SS53_9ARCH|nr:hypothetical protein [Candidatus Nitrosocosmicus arcticus]TVP39415.1 hypothetical protein NARC_150009 [Candidatus Nitrosocosmicus arcticus]